MNDIAPALRGVEVFASRAEESAGRTGGVTTAGTADPENSWSGTSDEAAGPEWRETLAFRRCRLVPAARLLLRDDQPVALGSRAFDLLHVLLRSRGALVGKNEIVNEVWPQTTVEESNLRFQMASLRKALGPDRDLVKTIPGRGYLFAADPAEARQERAGEEQADELRADGNASASQRAFRAATLERLASLLQRCIAELRQIDAEAGIPDGQDEASST